MFFLTKIGLRKFYLILFTSKSKNSPSLTNFLNDIPRDYRLGNSYKLFKIIKLIYIKMAESVKKLSSCDCINCANNIYIINKQEPKNCNYSNYFECKERIKFKDQIEPMNKTGYDYLNPQSVTNLYAKDFYEVDCEKEQIGGNCHDMVYSSFDPRLISGSHNGQRILLDRPPLDDGIKLANVYTDPNLKNYGKSIYKNYSDINNGQFLYYIDKSIEDDLFKPNFENPASVKGEIYKDPMGSTYPEYKRYPLVDNNYLHTKNRKYRYGLSSIDDTNEFREDIMHLQMRRQDRRRYEPRWTGNITY